MSNGLPYTLTARPMLEAKLSTGVRENGPPTGTTTLSAWTQLVRQPDEAVRKLISEARVLKDAYLKVLDEHGGDTKAQPVRDAKAAYDAVKDQSAWFMPAGLFPNGRKQTDVVAPSGIVFCEADYIPEGADIEGIRDSVASHPAVLAAWISLGGRGVHFLVSVWPHPRTREEHECAQWQAADAIGLGHNGIGNDPAVGNRERIVFQSSDARAYLISPDQEILPVMWDPDLPKPGSEPKPPPKDKPKAKPKPKAEKPEPEETGNEQPKSGNPHWQWFADHNPVHVENRNPLDLACLLLTDWVDAMIIKLTERVDKRGRPETHATAYIVDEYGMLRGDSATLNHMLYDTLDSLVAYARKQLTDPDAFANFCRWVSSNKIKASDVVDMIPSALVMAKARHPDMPLPEHADSKDFDLNPAVWGTPEGALDIRTLTILDPDETRKLRITASTVAAWDPKARHDAVDKVLPPLLPNGSLPDDIARYYGWCLTHPPHSDFGAEISETGAGKSTRQDVLRAGMGKRYITKCKRETFMESTYAKGGDTYNAGLFEMAIPAKMCFISEIKKGLHLTLIKDATGGEELLNARRIYQDDEEIRVGAHLIVQGNPVPPGETFLGLSSDGDGPAIRRRIRMFNIAPIPEDQQDDTLLDQCKSPEGRAAVVARCVEYARAMLDFGNTAPKTDAMKAREEEQIQTEKPDWVTDCLEGAIEPRADSDPAPPLDSWHAAQVVDRWWKEHKKNSRERGSRHQGRDQGHHQHLRRTRPQAGQHLPPALTAAARSPMSG